jgi:DNA-binding MarR family transcriptional regulator
MTRKIVKVRKRDSRVWRKRDDWTANSIRWASKARRHFDLSSHAYAVLVYFIGRGHATVRHKVIAADTGLSISSVQRAIRELESEDLVSSSDNNRRDGRWAAKTYRIRFVKVPYRRSH